MLDGDPAVLRDFAMATNFGTKIVIDWFSVNDSDYAIGYEGFEWSSDRMQILPIPCTLASLHLRDVAMATTFCFWMGCNFGCMIGSDTLFDSRVGFRGQAIR